MSFRKVACTLIAAAALGTGGCAMDPYQTGYPTDYPRYPEARYPGEEIARYGYVEAIDTVAPERREGVGVGAIGGAIVGGVLGHQVGSGSGNTAATIGGAVLGGVVGHQVEQQVRNRQGGPAVYDFRVRMDDGSYQTVRKETVDGIRVGDRVRLERGNVYLM